jgi:hypothetical protein
MRKSKIIGDVRVLRDTYHASEPQPSGVASRKLSQLSAAGKTIYVQGYIVIPHTQIGLTIPPNVLRE